MLNSQRLTWVWAYVGYTYHMHADEHQEVPHRFGQLRIHLQLSTSTLMYLKCWREAHWLMASRCLTAAGHKFLPNLPVQWSFQGGIPPASNAWLFMENPNLKWMMTRGTYMESPRGHRRPPMPSSHRRWLPRGDWVEHGWSKHHKTSRSWAESTKAGSQLKLNMGWSN